MSSMCEFFREAVRACQRNPGVKVKERELAEEIEQARSEILRLYGRLLEKALAERDESRKTVDRARKVTEYWHKAAMANIDGGRDLVEVAVAHTCACILMALDGEEGWREVARSLGLDEPEQNRSEQNEAEEPEETP